MASTRAVAGTLLLVATVARGDKPSVAKNLAPAAALEALKEGNARFVASKATHCQTGPRAREQLVAGQAPNAVVLSCSDSRVAPELIFDQGLGDLFTIRVAGNVLDVENVASIEYALEHLGARLIVIMGHDSCGAVKAALETPKGGDAGSPSLGALVAQIQTNLGARAATTDKTLRGPVKANVDAVAAALVEKSKIVKEAVASGRAKIVRAIYGLADGKVELWE
jgi:carbonic anhydrase